jgi:hypothetical protein
MSKLLQLQEKRRNPANNQPPTARVTAGDYQRVNHA